MMKKTKRIFKACNFSNLKKIENWLGEMEQNGWRVTKVYFARIFHFVECKPRKIKYFITITQSKGNSMDHYDYELLRNYNANEIPIVLCTLSLFRIKNTEKDISFIEECRLSFVYKELIIRMSCLLFLCILLSIVIFFERNKHGIWMLTLILIILLVALVHYFVYVYRCIKEINTHHRNNRNKEH